MGNLNIYSLIIIITLGFSLSSIIEIPLFEYYGTNDLKLRIGSSNYEKTLEIDMKRDFLWLNTLNEQELEKDTQLNRTFRKKIIKIGDKESKGEIIIGNIYLSNTKLENFPFYFVPGLFVDGIDSFPLSYKYSNESFSVIHNLYKNKVIEKRGFAIYMNNEREGSKLFLGGVPESYKEKYNFEAKVKIDNSSKLWGAILDRVSFKNKRYKIGNYSYFESNQREMVFPEYFFKLTVNFILKDFFLNKTCNVTESDDRSSIYCNASYTKYLPPFIFTFNNIRFTIPSSNLIKKTASDECQILIITKKNQPNDWVIGLPFFKSYLSYFDHDEGAMTFYSDNSFGEDTDDEPGKVYCIILLVLLIFAILFLSYGLLFKKY